MPAPFPIPPNSPVSRETSLTSPLAFKVYPLSVADLANPARPVVVGSIATVAYNNVQTPILSPLAITKNFPGT